MQKQLNLKVKYRESFRPFAPSILYEHLSEWFDKPKVINSIFNNISHHVDRVAFVDSYGALTPENIISFMKRINFSYKNKFEYGCHFHNNCGLALANSIIANKNGCEILCTQKKMWSQK